MGPQVTVPLAGVYLAEVKVEATLTSAGNLQTVAVAAVNGTTEETCRVLMHHPTSTAGFNFTGTVRRPITVGSANANVRVRYRSPGGAAATWRERSIVVTPIRVG